MTSLSFFEPPGWIMPLMLFFEHNLTISEKGKKPSDARTGLYFLKFSKILPSISNFNIVNLFFVMVSYQELNQILYHQS